MNWLVWRQHRKAFLIMAGIIAAYIAGLLWVGHQNVIAYNHALADGRVPGFYPKPLATALPPLSIVIPLLLGMFWGASFIAKEYAENTTKFIWAQGISRRKWLLTKLAWMIAIATIYGIALSLAVTWASRVNNAITFGRFTPLHFNTQGLMPAVYSIFAITLGAWVGAWRRQVLSSVAITAALFIGIVGVMSLYVRPHYMPPKIVKGGLYSEKVNATGQSLPKDPTAWELNLSYKVISKDCSTTNGQKFCSSIVQVEKTTYQPANRYWVFQGIEATLFLLGSVALIGATLRVITKRDA